MEVVFINPEKIRSVIGPGGKNIKAITAETGASIDIEDSGKVAIFAPTSESLRKAKAMVQYYDQTPEPGRNYLGTVRKILEVGALVEILPGAEGMLHVSQMDVERVERVEDLLQLGPGGLGEGHRAGAGRTHPPVPQGLAHGAGRPGSEPGRVPPSALLSRRRPGTRRSRPVAAAATVTVAVAAIAADAARA